MADELHFEIGFTEGMKPVITVNSNGNWAVDGKDTGCPARGPQGSKGDKGDKPVVTIVNDYWYIDGMNTGVKATCNLGDMQAQVDTISSRFNSLIKTVEDNPKSTGWERLEVANDSISTYLYSPLRYRLKNGIVTILGSLFVKFGKYELDSEKLVCRLPDAIKPNATVDTFARFINVCGELNSSSDSGICVWEIRGENLYLKTTYKMGSYKPVTSSSLDYLYNATINISYPINGDVENWTDELTDARVGVGGATYSTIGDAIRSQYTDAREQMLDYQMSVDTQMRSTDAKVQSVSDTLGGSIGQANQTAQLNSHNIELLAIKPTVEGEGAVTIEDSADMAIRELHLLGKSTQDGTPTDVVNPTVTVYGKNRLKCTAKTATISGITYTVNDGTIACTGIASASDSLRIMSTPISFDSDMYLTGCPTGGSSSTYEIMAYSKATTYRCCGTAVKIPKGTTIDYINIVMRKGYTASNLKFEPMLSVDGSTFETYKESSQQYKYTLCSVGDVRDELIVNADGTGKLIQRVSDYAPLATPIITELSNMAVLSSYYPTTCITASDAGLCVKYVADTKNYIDKQLLELSAALVDTAAMSLMNE